MKAATLAPMALSPSGNPCAWCLEEHGVKPSAGDSHGICLRHADELTAASRARKAERARGAA